MPYTYKVNINEIKIDGDWTGHCKLISYYGETIGYLRHATCNRIEAISLFKRTFTPIEREVIGSSMKGHDSSMLIAAVDMISNMYMYDMFDENNIVIDKFRKEKIN